MTYIPEKGNFAVGILSADTNIPNSTATFNQGTLNLSTFYTTLGLLTQSPKVTGVAYSDTTCKSGFGVSPYVAQSPTTNGGFGTDIPENTRTNVGGSSLGCGVYNNQNILLAIHNYDKDIVIAGSYVCCFGVVS